MNGRKFFVAFIVSVVFGLSALVYYSSDADSKSFIEKQIENINQVKPDLVVLGNSGAINCCVNLEANKYLLYIGGTNDMSWYFMFKNIVLESERLPKYLMIPFWGDFIIGNPNLDSVHLPTVAKPSELDIVLADESIETRLFNYLNSSIKVFVYRSKFAALYESAFRKPYELIGKSMRDIGAGIAFSLLQTIKKAVWRKDLRSMIDQLADSKEALSEKIYWSLRKLKLIPLNMALKESIGNARIQQAVISKKIKSEHLLKEDDKADWFLSPYIRKIITLSKQNNIEVIFLGLKHREKAKNPNLKYPEYDFTRKALAEMNVHFISIYETPLLKYDHYRDAVHMNINGAKIAADLIDADLKRIMN